MTYGEFWDKEPELTRSYHKAECIRVQNKSDSMWLQGLYFYNAISVALGNFGAGLGGKVANNKYMSEPIRVIPKSKEELEEEKRKKIEAYISELKAWQSNFNAKRLKDK